MCRSALALRRWLGARVCCVQSGGWRLGCVAAWLRAAPAGSEPRRGQCLECIATKARWHLERFTKLLAINPSIRVCYIQTPLSPHILLSDVLLPSEMAHGFTTPFTGLFNMISTILIG